MQIRPIRPTGMFTDARFDQWLMSAEPGDSIIYHRGCLSTDRTRTGERGDRVRRLAEWVYMSSERRSVVLMQRRHGAGDYDYIAQKARPRDGWKFTPKFKKGMGA